MTWSDIFGFIGDNAGGLAQGAGLLGGGLLYAFYNS